MGYLQEITERNLECGDEMGSEAPRANQAMLTRSRHQTCFYNITKNHCQKTEVRLLIPRPRL